MQQTSLKRPQLQAPSFSYGVPDRLIVDARARRSVLRWTSQLPYPCTRESTAGHVTIIAYGTAKNFFSRALFERQFALAFTAAAVALEMAHRNVLVHDNE